MSSQFKERGWLAHQHEVKAILDGRQTQFRRVIKPQPAEKGYSEIAPYCTGSPEHGYAYYRHGGVAWKSTPPIKCPFGQPGDRLWVRHAWWHYADKPNRGRNEQVWDEYTKIVRWPNGQQSTKIEPILNDQWRRRPSIHMPRWASRITLEVVNVRVERVQEISGDDAKAEGIDPLFSYQKIHKEPKYRSELDLDPMPYRNYLWHGNFGSMGGGNKQSNEWEHQFSSYKTPQGSFSSLWHLINAKRGFGWDANPWVWCISYRRID